MDVDGTLTNGKIWMGNEGEEYKAFDVKDGYGIAHLLPLMKITPVVITGRKSEIVERRCRELGILECHQAVSYTHLDMYKRQDESLARIVWYCYIYI